MSVTEYMLYFLDYMHLQQIFWVE